jgi:hypothetical protein
VGFREVLVYLIQEVKGCREAEEFPAVWELQEAKGFQGDLEFGFVEHFRLVEILGHGFSDLLLLSHFAVQ